MRIYCAVNVKLLTTVTKDGSISIGVKNLMGTKLFVASVGMLAVSFRRSSKEFNFRIVTRNKTRKEELSEFNHTLLALNEDCVLLYISSLLPEKDKWTLFRKINILINLTKEKK